MLDSLTYEGNEQIAMGILAGLLLLVVLAITSRVRRRRKPSQRRQRPAAARPRTVEPAPTPAPGAALGEPTSTGTGKGLQADAASCAGVEVGEADLLSEVAVYLEYGYLDRAAFTLRYFVDQMGSDDPLLLHKLLDIYLRLEQMDDYAETLERLTASGGGDALIRDSVLAGLRVDPENLQLRVLAEYQLGLGMEQLNALLGATQPPKPEAKTPTNAESAAPDRSTRTQDAPQPASEPGRDRKVLPAKSGPVRKMPLVAGEARLEPLSVGEKAVLRVFANPRLMSRLHMSTRDLDEAKVALRQAIEADPTDLDLHKDLLKICWSQRNQDEYARAMWRLYKGFRGHGQSLRERLLSIGFSMGTHPVLEALAQIKEPGEIDRLGRRFGYERPVEAPARKLRLVEGTQTSAPAAGRGRSRDVLKEVDALLEYGQTDQAQVLLERAVIAMPRVAQLYPPLLELYDRMDDLARLAALAGAIKKRGIRPSEEAVVMMTSLFQRLKQRKQQQSAA